MTTDWLLGWHNLIFILPFAVALLYLLLYAVSGVTFGDADMDGGVDMDHDVNMDHDVETHHGIHAHAGVGHGDYIHGADDAGLTPDPGPVKAALMWLGVGRVPLSILLMVLLLSWGVSGFIANQGVHDRFAGSWRVILVSLPVAAVLAILVTRVVVRSIDRWLPLDETTARRRHDLLGLSGVAMYDINDHFGMLTLRDDRGELHQVPCRVAEGHAPIAKNGDAVLVSYNKRENLYKVVAPEHAAAQ